MKISFFQKDGTFNQGAITAGVYIFKIGLADGTCKSEEYIPLYIGESYSMAIRCSQHLYEVFCKNPSYFGLSEKHIKDNRLELIVEVYDAAKELNRESWRKRNFQLRNREQIAIDSEHPLSQMEKSDRLRRDRVAVVGKAIDRLLETHGYSID